MRKVGQADPSSLRRWPWGAHILLDVASRGARRWYDAHRARGQTHHQALRALGNRLVGILHGCLAHRVIYQEQVAWPPAESAA
jgi:hypothetical protein